MTGIPHNPNIPHSADQNAMADQKNENTVPSGGGGGGQAQSSKPIQAVSDPSAQKIPDTVAELREKIQQDIVAVITKKLEAGEMTEDRAKAIAKMTLEKLPETLSYEELMKVVPTLDDEFEELKGAIYPIIIDYQKKVSAKVKEKIELLLKSKRYMEVLDLTKKAIAFERSLG